MDRTLMALAILLWMPLAGDVYGAQPTPLPSPPATPGKTLPEGFVPVAGTKIDPAGWPREIRCLKDDSVMVFVPGGPFASGLTDKQIETLAQIQLDLAEPDWQPMAPPGESLDEAIKQVTPGKLLSAKDLQDLPKLTRTQQAAIVFLGDLQDSGVDVPAGQLATWRSGDRTFGALLRLPAVQKHLALPPGMKIEDFEKLVAPVFATPQEQRKLWLANETQTLKLSLQAAEPATVGSFYIDKYEVTNRRYRRFFAQADDPDRRPSLPYGPTYNIGGPKNPKVYHPWDDPKRNGDDQPVTCVGRKDVLAYAKWAGKRLPTRLQWERAAIGDGGRLFPWGSDFKVGRCRCDVKPPPRPTTRPGVGGIVRDLLEIRREWRKLREGAIPAAVGQFGKDVSPYGCHDLGGNVSEWVILSPGPPPADPVLAPMGGNAGSMNLRQICPAMKRSDTEPGKFVGFRTILPVR